MQNSGSGSLQMGSRGSAVASVQSKLNALLTPSPQLVVDGVFGLKTSQAVKQFQQRRGLTADGIVGPKTAAALGLPNPGQGGGGGGGGAGGGGSGGGGGAVGPVPGPPTAFVDLSEFNVVVEAIIGGAQAIASNLLSWIDSDFVTQEIYDRVAGTVNGSLNTMASQLRGITRQTLALGQDPAAFVTGRVHDIVARYIANLCAGVQPLTGLPIIGTVAVRYQNLLRSVLAVVDQRLANLRRNGQGAQAVATEIAGALANIARQIG